VAGVVLERTVGHLDEQASWFLDHQRQQKV
jgi:hypothetical protein